MADLGAVGENGLLTKRTSFGQASPWDNNGAEQGLITKRTGLYLDLAWDNNGGENGLLTKRSFFQNMPEPDNPAPNFPQAEVVNPFACKKAIKGCSDPIPF